jgi:hypothetical protein
LEKLVNQCGFPMVNVGNDGEISNFQIRHDNGIKVNLREKGARL